MEERYICEKHLEHFRKHLIHEEKSQATIEKYMRDVGTFFAFLTGKKLEKERTIEYKHDLQERNYSIRSINSMLTALNHFLEFIGRHDWPVDVIEPDEPRLDVLGEVEEDGFQLNVLPMTGDMTVIWPYLVVLVLALIGLIVLIKGRRKEEEK